MIRDRFISPPDGNVENMYPPLEEIRKRRTKLGLSQRNLAKELHVSQSTIAKIENGKTNPTYGSVKRIFDYLDNLQSSEIGDVGSIASRPVTSVGKFDNVQKAIRILQEHGFKQLPIVDGNHWVGSVSERGISGLIIGAKNPAALLKRSVWQFMDEALPQVPERTPISDVVPLLQRSQAVLTTKRGEVTGIATNADLLKLLTKYA